MKILVVDDVPAMRRIMTSLLGELGYNNLEEAENGEAALEKIRSAPFDLVITDWNMPVMPGIELLRSIRNDPALRDLPVLMVTAEPDNVSTAREAGVDGYILKPFGTEALREKIDAAVKKRCGK